jgi:hypothetical protein
MTRPRVPSERYTLSPPSISGSCRSTRTRAAPTRGGGSGRRGTGTPSETTGKRTGELLVAHAGSPTPEVIHQSHLLVGEVMPNAASLPSRSLLARFRNPASVAAWLARSLSIFSRNVSPRVLVPWRCEFTVARARLRLLQASRLRDEPHFHRTFDAEPDREAQRRCRNRRRPRRGRSRQRFRRPLPISRLSASGHYTSARESSPCQGRAR